MTSKIALIFIPIMVSCLCSACTYVIREQDLLYPRPVSQHVQTRYARNITLTTRDGVKLGGWIFEHKHSDRYLIYFYGNGERVIDIGRRLLWISQTYNINVLSMDYRGYGFSKGRPTLDNLQGDCLEIIDQIQKNLKVTSDRIYLYGRSLGSTMAVHAAASRKVAGLILEAAPTSAAEVVPEMKRMASWSIRPFVRTIPDEKLKNRSPQPIDNIRNITIPLLVIHGEKDRLIPARFGKKMFDAAGSEKKIWCPVAGAGHNNLPINSPTVQEAMTRFFNFD